MTDREIMAASERLLRPYRLPETCPYLSEDQRELSLLDLRQRSAWMAEWLLLAAARTPRVSGSRPAVRPGVRVPAAPARRRAKRP